MFNSLGVTPLFVFLVLFTTLLQPSLAIPSPRLVASRDVPISDPPILTVHNHVRAAHDAPALMWSEDLALLASMWANQCLFQNTNGVLRPAPYGENIAAATGNFTADDVVSLFISDESQYDPAHPTYNHFTQVVWKTTTMLGCAVATCDRLFAPMAGPATLYVCLYDPPGNVIGLASINVDL